MKAFMITIITASVLAWSGKTMSQSGPPKLLAQFPGVSLRWIKAAEPVFQEKKIDLDRYTISIQDDGVDRVTVMLESPDSMPGGRGSTGSLSGFAVEIRKADRTILKAYYMR